MRLRLQDGMTLLTEALLWTGCVYVATLLPDAKTGEAQPYAWLVLMGWAVLLLFVVTRFIPCNAYSRTARRDEVVACAMKTALAFGILSFAAFPERTEPQLVASGLFFVAITAERLILNSWAIRYYIHHPEHGIILCEGNATWQQEALQQNTYGLKLNRLQEQTAQQLEAYLAEHPEAESVYCSTSFLPATELADVAHTCRKQGVVLHLLPLAPSSMPQTMQGECRGTVCVLSPAKLPLQSILRRTVKRLTDIVLSLLVLLTVFPLFALIAFICIKRQSRGPVLVSQHMCGMNGKTFRSLTFRTRHYEAAPSFFDGTSDPGYFSFGKFLMHSRLDLLPQFICVLRGTMTIVGSTVMQPEQYAAYRSELRQHFATDCRLKAGITSYRLASQSKGSTEADIWYCRNWGFWLDVRIMLQRLGTLLSKSKAQSINYI